MHCDLASRNILIAEGFLLKIADFGLARETSDDGCYVKSSEVSFNCDILSRMF